MGVYVDELIVYPNAWGPFKKGSCHMTADTPDELHDLANKIGLKRAWFQKHPIMDHYDLTPGKREAALSAGAVFMSWREQSKRRRAARTVGVTTPE